MPALKTSVVPVPGGETIARLDASAAEMTAAGWAACLTTTLGRPPRLVAKGSRR